MLLWMVTTRFSDDEGYMVLASFTPTNQPSQTPPPLLSPPPSFEAPLDDDQLLDQGHHEHQWLEGPQSLQYNP